MVQQSQGFIVDRTRETSTQTDGCVVKFRRRMEDAKRLADGEEPRSALASPTIPPPPPALFHQRHADEDVLMERFGTQPGPWFSAADAHPSTSSG